MILYNDGFFQADLCARFKVEKMLHNLNLRGVLCRKSDLVGTFKRSKSQYYSE